MAGFSRIADPKKEGSRKGPVSKAKAKAKAAATAASEPLETNLLLQTPAHVCKTCSQSTHDYEKDWRGCGKRYVKWHKTYTQQDGKVYAQSEECYYCFDTRRRSFFDTQAVLCENMDKCPPIADKCFKVLLIQYCVSTSFSIFFD